MVPVQREGRSVKESEWSRSEETLDRGLFETLFQSHADSVLAYALRRSDADTAQEVVAETFTIAWRRFEDVPEPALPWLLGVARRVLANSRRSSSRQEALALRLVGQPSGANADPTREVDVRLAARAALEQLPPAEREAIELLAWEGLTSAEAAETLGCSRQVFAVRVHRGRRRLRRLLSESVGDMESSDPIPRSAPSADVRSTPTTQEAK
jgi:RNA polymerase sigma-70 factor, ECF subfamily